MEEDEEEVIERTTRKLPRNPERAEGARKAQGGVVYGSAYAAFHARLTAWRRRGNERPDTEVRSSASPTGSRRRGLCSSTKETDDAREGPQQSHERHPDDSDFGPRIKGCKEKVRGVGGETGEGSPEGSREGGGKGYCA